MGRLLGYILIEKMENKKTEHTSNSRVCVRIPRHECTLTRALEMNDREILSVVFARLFDRRDSQLQANEAEGLARRDRIALLRQWDIFGFEIEGVQVVVVQEADNPRPRAGHTVRVECV